MLASADSSRMVISVLDISSEKITAARLCFTAAWRANIECEGRFVGRNHRPTSEIEVIGTVHLYAADGHQGDRADIDYEPGPPAIRRTRPGPPSCTSGLPVSRKTWSSVVKVSVKAIERSSWRPRTRLVLSATR